MAYKIIVTGANGMLGSTLCIAYHNSHRVFALHRDSQCYVPCHKDYSFDLTLEVELKKVFNLVNPDLVIHCAGIINMDLCEQEPELAYFANVAATENIAQACNQGTKLVYISTDQVYGDNSDRSESNMELKSINQYGNTKYLGEEKAAKHCPNCIITRTNIFGWNVKPGKVSSAEWIYDSLKNGKEITLFDDYIFSPVYTEDLGEIIMQLVNMDFSGVVNVGPSIPCSKYEFGKQLAEKFMFDNYLINKASINDHSFEASRAKNLFLNTRRLTELGISVPDYKTSIKKFKENQFGS